MNTNPYKQVVIIDDINVLNDYLKKGGILIDTLISRTVENSSFNDYIRYVVGTF